MRLSFSHKKQGWEFDFSIFDLFDLKNRSTVIVSISSTFEKDRFDLSIAKKRSIRSKNRCSNSQPWLKVSTRPTEWIGGSHQHLRWRKFTPVFKKRPYSTQRAFVNITIPTQKWHRCTPITNLKMPSFLRFPFVKSGSITV